MATTTFLSNATVNITQGATTWDVSDQASAVSLTVGKAELDATVMGDTGSKMVGGLQTVEVSMTLFLSYGTGEVEEMLAAIVGQGSTTLVISPSGTSESASNAEYTILNSMCPSASVINSTVGELATVELTFTSGTWTRDITPPTP
jgi:hypothetical protein